MKKYLGVMVLSVLLVAPGTLFAETDSLSTDTLIAKLQKQVSELLGQIEKLKSGKTTELFCYNFNKDFGIGGSGADVSALRKVFKSGGFDADSEGDFDEDFAALVVKFQGKHGIRQTGFVGPMTRAKLNALHGCDRSAAQKEKELKALKPEVKKEKEKEKEKVASAVPVLLKTDGNVTRFKREAYVYLIGQHMGLLTSGTLTNSSGSTTKLEVYVKGGEMAKVILPKDLALGQYQLSVTNSLGTSNALTIEVVE